MLTGYVKEKQGGSPINGAHVIIAGKTAGISGPDGKYLIQNLTRGAELTVIYGKMAYELKKEPVTLGDSITTHDVSLLKDTVEANYWMDMWKGIRPRQGSGSQARSDALVFAWDDVSASDISPEAKVSAAKQFPFPAVEPSTPTPPSLKAYGSFDAETVGVAKANFDQAIIGRANVPDFGTTVPADVATDIAAKQVRKFAKGTRRKPWSRNSSSRPQDRYRLPA